MADYAVANGLACYDCGYSRCCCDENEADWIAADTLLRRKMHRTHSLMRAIELAEIIIDRLPEGDPRIEKLFEKHDTLTAALLNHRRVA